MSEELIDIVRNCQELVHQCIKISEKKSTIIGIINSPNFPLIIVSILFVFYLCFLVLYTNKRNIKFVTSQSFSVEESDEPEDE